ncbi:MAG: DUF4160 domain-containing protein [Bdellovibrionota bacterium]
MDYSDSLEKNGYRFFFYTEEANEPAHIHVIEKGGEMKIWLEPVEVSKFYRLKPKEQKEVITIAREI